MKEGVTAEHLEPEARSKDVHGKAGITFGRQNWRISILVGMNYMAPLETYSNIMVTGHGARSITGIEIGLDWRTATEKQLAAIPLAFLQRALGI